MKKFFTLTLLCFLSVMAWGATTGFINGVNYTIYEDGTASVYSFNAYASDFTEEIVIPETLTYEENDYRVTSVEANGLQGISQVTRITVTTVSLPSTIESLGNFALSGCTTVSTIYCYAETPPSLGNNSLSKVSATVYVPDNSVSDYESKWTSTGSGATSLTFVGISSAPGGTGGSGDSPVMVVTPANGEEVKASLSEIVVSCEDGIEWNVNQGFYFTVTNDKDEVVAGVWNAVAVEDADGTLRSYTLPLYDDAITTSDVPITLTTPGEYKFTLPEKCFYLGSSKQESASVEVSFTIVEDGGDTGGTGEVPYTLEPENESSVSTLESFDLLWNDNGEYNKNNNGVGWNDMSASGWSGIVYDDNNVEITTLYMDEYLYPEGESFATGTEPYGLRFAYYNPITDPGTYTVTIPSGMVRFGETSHGSLGTYYEDIVVKYTVVGAGYSVSPASGSDVTSLTSVTITADEGEISLTSEESLSVTNAAGTEVTTATVKVESGELVITLENAITNPSQAGEYHIVVPAGTFTCNGVANDNLNLVYYVNPDVEYTLDPADGDTKESISTVTVGYHDGVCVASGVAMSSITITGDNGTVYPMASYEALEETYEGDTDATIYAIVLNLETAITTSGTYTLNIPKNSLQFYVGASEGDDEGVGGGGVNDGWIDSNLITATYIVEASEVAKTFDYTLDPPAGEVSSLHSITISYEDGIQLNAKESQWGNIKVYDEGGNEVVEVVYASPIIGEGYYTEATYIGYTFTLGKDMSSQDVTAAGEYDFVIPAEYISFYDAESGQYVKTTEDIKAHYIITSGGTSQPLTYEVDPAEGEVPSLSKITFLREAGIVSQVGEEDQMPLSSLYVCDDNGNIVAYVGGVSYTDDDNWKLYSTSITYELTNDVVDEGTYHFIVPAGAFALYDNGDLIDCEDIELTYYVTGGAEATGLVFDPESNTTHKSLSGFTVTYTGEGGMSVTTMPNDGASVYLEGDDSGEEYTYASYEEIYDDSGLCVSVEFTFAKELTEDGTYDVVIPAELLYYGHGGVNEEDIILVYIIGTPTGINGISINGENVEGIYSVGGQKLNTMVKGVNIVRMNDGTTKKVLVK